MINSIYILSTLARQVNIVNEKIYLTLYFWFYFLILFTIIFLTIRLISFSSSSIRHKVLRSKAPLLNQTIAFKFSRFSGCWFVMKTLCDNMKPSEFASLIDCCYREHFENDQNSKFDYYSKLNKFKKLDSIE